MLMRALGCGNSTKALKQSTTIDPCIQNRTTVRTVVINLPYKNNTHSNRYLLRSFINKSYMGKLFIDFMAL